MVRFRFWQLAIIIAVSVGFVVALFTVAEFGRARLAEAADDVRHAQQQWIRVVDLQQILLDAESGHRGYLLTGDPRHLAPLANARERIDTLARELAAADLGRDERVAKAIRLLQSVADNKVTEMNASVALYRQQGPVAALAIADSASGQEVMGRFRELAGITRDYEQSLVERSLRNWDRELSVVRRLNLATLVVGLMLAGLAITAMLRNMRQRHDAAVDLARQHDLLKAQADAQAAELNELYRHLQHVQEEERARLSRGLHDELGGVLLAARMDVTWMQHNSPHDPEEFQERLERVRRALDQGIDLKRRVVEELRPTLLDTMGLVAALRWQIEEACKRADLRCIENFPEVEPQFSRAGAITLFRVVQEALANVLKHARAKEVSGRDGNDGRARRADHQRRRCRLHHGGPRQAKVARHRRDAPPRPRARRPARHRYVTGARHSCARGGSAGQRDAADGRRCGYIRRFRRHPLGRAERLGRCSLMKRGRRQAP